MQTGVLNLKYKSTLDVLPIPLRTYICIIKCDCTVSNSRNRCFGSVFCLKTCLFLVIFLGYYFFIIEVPYLEKNSNSTITTRRLPEIALVLLSLNNTIFREISVLRQTSSLPNITLNFVNLIQLN